MGFSTLQVSRCRIHSFPYIQSKSLGSFWSENFLSFRNMLWSGSNFKLVGSHNFEESQGGLNMTCILRPITTETKARAKYIERSKLSNFRHEFVDATVTETARKTALSRKSIHFCDTPQKILNDPDLKNLVKVFVIDIETTGFCKDKGRIIEIAIRDLLGGEDSCFETLINPSQDIPNSHIHRITNEMVNQPDVPRMKDLIPILIKYIRSRQIPGGFNLLAAHNGRTFDVPFLIKEFSRCSEEIPDNWLFLDTLPLARELMKSRGSNLYSLEALRVHYKIPESGFKHRAMSDVNVLSLVLEMLTFDLKLTLVDLVGKSFKASV